MIAGTALIQVIRSAVIRSQNPRLLNLRSTARYAPARSVASSPTTSALTWNSGSEQYPRSARPSRCQSTTLDATCASCSSRSKIPFGVPVVPLVQRKIPPPWLPAVNGERSKAVIPNGSVASPSAAIAPSGRSARRW